jgi:hypothetical protein
LLYSSQHLKTITGYTSLQSYSNYHGKLAQLLAQEEAY